MTEAAMLAAVGGRALSTLGTGARWARGVGLGRLMRAGRDGADAVFVRLGRPPLKAEVGGLTVRGYLRHRLSRAPGLRHVRGPSTGGCSSATPSERDGGRRGRAHRDVHAARVPRRRAERPRGRDRARPVQRARARGERSARELREREDRAEGARGRSRDGAVPAEPRNDLGVRGARRSRPVPRARAGRDVGRRGLEATTSTHSS